MQKIIIIIVFLATVLSACSTAIPTEPHPILILPVVSSVHKNIGPNNPVSWDHTQTMFFVGSLNIVADHEFTVTNRKGLFITSSVADILLPEQMMPKFRASFTTTPGGFYRVTSDVSITSTTETEEIFILNDPNVLK